MCLGSDNAPIFFARSVSARRYTMVRFRARIAARGFARGNVLLCIFVRKRFARKISARYRIRPLKCRDAVILGLTCRAVNVTAYYHKINHPPSPGDRIIGLLMTKMMMMMIRWLFVYTVWTSIVSMQMCPAAAAFVACRVFSVQHWLQHRVYVVPTDRVQQNIVHLFNIFNIFNI